MANKDTGGIDQMDEKTFVYELNNSNRFLRRHASKFIISREFLSESLFENHGWISKRAPTSSVTWMLVADIADQMCW